MIKYEWTNRALLKVERWVHVALWAWALGTSSMAAGLGYLNLVGPVCWISDPPECYSDPVPADTTCRLLAVLAFCLPPWITIVLTIYGVVTIYFEVKTKTRNLDKYQLRGSGVEIHSRRRSSSDIRKVAIRAVLYSIAFIITWTPSTIYSVGEFFRNVWYPFWESYLWTIFEPLQGFWNALIFCYNDQKVRSRYSGS